MSTGGRFSKKFSSLDKRRRTIGGNVYPINSLSGTADEGSKSRSRTASPVADKTDASSRLSMQIKHSERLRKSLEHELSSFETHKEKKTISVRSVGGKLVTLSEDTWEHEHLESLPLTQLDWLGKIFELGSLEDMAVRVASDDQYILVKKSTAYVTVIERETEFKNIYFSAERNAFLIEAAAGCGYVYAEYSAGDDAFYQFFVHSKTWNMEPPSRVIKKSFDERLAAVREKDKKNRSSRELASLDFPTASPQLMYGKTRAASRRLGLYTGLDSDIDSIGICDAGIRDENPRAYDEAKDLFKNELKFRFKDNKVFSITFADFKTLFNNEWINDTLIDFFIKYEVEKAIHEYKVLDEGSIHAFNSFFFTKLTSGEGSAEPIDYYGNIKRWLNKLNLMSYPYVIIPINEKLHWYGCIIKDLPKLLQGALKRNQLSQNSEKDISATNEDIPSLLELLSNGYENEQSSKACAEIFVFDSMRQRHKNIHTPLKQFIIDYCKDKYGVEIYSSEIRIYSARVPKQNNFNDCGIHVIYNVRKWLSNIKDCEKLWRGFNQHSLLRSIFVAEERNNLRKELRNKLIELKKEQAHEDDKNTEKDVEDSDDDIKVIEYTPSENGSDSKLEVEKEKEQEKSEKKAPETPARPVNKAKSSTPVTPSRSGPNSSASKKNVLSSEKVMYPDLFRKYIGASPTLPLKNKELEKFFLGEKLPRPLVRLLNRHYTRFDKVKESHFKYIRELKTSLSQLDVNKDQDAYKQAVDRFLKNIERLGSEESKSAPARPKDEELVIKYDAENEDINQRVHDLTICNDSESTLHDLSGPDDSFDLALAEDSPVSDQKRHLKTQQNLSRVVSIEEISSTAALSSSEKQHSRSQKNELQSPEAIMSSPTLNRNECLKRRKLDTSEIT